MLFLVWFDDNGKKADEKKVAEGIAAYFERFKVRPNVVLVNKGCVVPDIQGVRVKQETTVQKNNFWIGME